MESHTKRGLRAYQGSGRRDSRHKKSPVAGPGSEGGRNRLVPGEPGAFQAGYPLPPFTLATFAATTLTRFFITLLELKPSEQAIILDLFLKHFHGPLKVTVNDLDLQATKLSQVYLPFLSIAGLVEKARKPGCWCELLRNIFLYKKIFPKTTKNLTQMLQ